MRRPRVSIASQVGNADVVAVTAAVGQKDQAGPNPGLPTARYGVAPPWPGPDVEPTRGQVGVRRLGYCTTCHEQVVMDSGISCRRCGNDVVDVVTRGESLAAPAASVAAGSAPALEPLAVHDVGQKPPGGANPETRSRTRGVLVMAAISLLASGLMMAASFLPWLKPAAGGGRPISGWDLYELQRDAGDEIFVIPTFFTDSEGTHWAFTTGLATLVSGLGLAALSVIFLTWAPWLRRRKPLVRFPVVPLSMRVVGGLHFLLIIIAVLPPFLNARAYFEAGGASGASLEYGLILLWVATLVGASASLGGHWAVWTNSRREFFMCLLLAAIAVTFIGVSGAVWAS